MKISWAYIKLLCLLGLTVFLLVFAIRRNEMRQVEKVTIAFADESTPFVTRETVNKLLIVSGENLAGTAKENLALSKMEKRVSDHPIIKEADVYMTMSGEIGVTIEQRKPIARINGDPSLYMDELGVMMPLSQNFSAHVPLVSGTTKKDTVQVYKLVSFIRDDSFLAKHIIGITRSSNGEYILQGRKLEFKIELGKVEKLEKRFSNYKAFYQKALKDKSLNNYKSGL